MLLQAGADPSAQCIGGRTPLHTFFNPLVSSFYLYYGDSLDFDKTIADDSGLTPWHFLAWTNQSSPDDLHAFTRSASEVDIAAQDSLGRTALHLAACRGNKEVVSYLLDPSNDFALRSRLLAPDKRERTPLHYATKSRRARAIVEQLVHLGLDPGTVDSEGCSLLHHATQSNSVALVQFILDQGYVRDLWQHNQAGLAAADLADACGANAVGAYLRSFSRPRERGAAREENEKKACAPLVKKTLSRGLLCSLYTKGSAAFLLGILFGVMLSLVILRYKF